MARKRKVLTVSVDLDIIDTINTWSKDTRINRSVLVNDILVDYFKNFRKNNKGVSEEVVE